MTPAAYMQLGPRFAAGSRLAASRAARLGLYLDSAPPPNVGNRRFRVADSTPSLLEF